MLAKYDHEVGWAYCECTKVKHLVVQRAQRKPILLDIRTASLKPFYVRGFERDYLLLEAQIMAADATTVLVGEKNFFAERRIAVAGSETVTTAFDGFEGQTNRIKHVLPNAFREMCV